MNTFIDQLKKHVNKNINFCLDDDDPLNEFKITEVGDDYVIVTRRDVNRIIPISKITYIQEL